MGTSQGRERDAGGKKREGAIKHQSYSNCKRDDLQMNISWVGPLGWIKSSRSSWGYEEWVSCQQMRQIHMGAISCCSYSTVGLSYNDCFLILSGFQSECWLMVGKDSWTSILKALPLQALFKWGHWGEITYDMYLIPSACLVQLVNSTHFGNMYKWYNTVTGRTRRKTCGSMCTSLFKGVVTNRHGSVNSKQTWMRQDKEYSYRTSVGLRSVNSIQQGKAKRDNPGTQQ